MKILAFESSTRLGGVALLEDENCVHHRESESQKSHSEVLHQFTFEILEAAKTRLDEISCFAVGIGPGSFTGIRVSLNTAKTFSYALNRPLVAIDSLRNLAFLNLRHPGERVLCLINAYKNMCYFGLYEWDATGPKPLMAPSVIPMKDIQQVLKDPVMTVGDGFLTYEKFLPPSIRAKMVRPPRPVDFPRAESLARLAKTDFEKGLTLDWKSLKPLYIRSSEAEENQRGIVWSPLDFKE